MQAIQFSFKKNLTAEQREEALARLAALPGIQQAGLLYPDTTNAAVQRMGVAKVVDEADLPKVLAAIETQPEVEQASAPPRKKLIK